MIRWFIAMAMVIGALFFAPSANTIDNRHAEILTPETRFIYTVKLTDRYYVASYYADYFHGRRTASGDIFNMYGISVAHKTLPFGTVVEFRNPRNGRTVTATVNDRGPYIAGREFDLSYGAALALGMVDAGIVELEAVVRTRRGSVCTDEG